MRFYATELFIFVDASFDSHVTVKSDIKQCSKLISQNTGELLWIIIQTNIVLKQNLCRTEIEGNHVENYSSIIFNVW